MAAGSGVTFTAGATGTNEAPTVQWEFSSDDGNTFTAITNATLTTYSFTATPGENGDEYEAVFTSGLATASSTAATLSVDSVSITTDPISQEVAAGSSVTITAAATAIPSPTVQWEVSTNGGSSFSVLTGATSTSYSFTATAADNGDKYEAVFTAGLAQGEHHGRHVHRGLGLNQQ